MNWKRRKETMQRCSKSLLLCLPLMGAAVFLTGCSTLLDDATIWAAAEKVPAPAVKPVAVAETKTPDVPPAIAKCLEAGHVRAKQNAALAAFQKKHGRAPNADELVVQDMQSTEERNKCALALLQWYRQIQQANKKAVAKA